MADEERKASEQAATGEGPQQTVEIVHGITEAVQAHRVIIRQGLAREVRARESVEIRQGGAMTIDAQNVSMVQGVAALVRSGKVELGPGSRSVAVLGDTVEMDQAGTCVMVAREGVEMEQSGALVMVAPQVTARNSSALFIFADRVEGDMQVAMDRQSAAAFGAAFGAMLGVVLVLARLLRGRR